MMTNTTTEHPAVTGAPCRICGRGFLSTASAIWEGGAWVHPACWLAPAEVRTRLLDLALEVTSLDAAARVDELAGDCFHRGWVTLGLQLQTLRLEFLGGEFGVQGVVSRLRVLASEVPDIG